MTKLLLILGSVCLFSNAAFSQSNATDAALDGYVFDPTSSTVSGARVVARNLTTNLESSTVTNEQGYYRFPLLKIGEYEISVSQQGFTDFRQTGVVLNIGRQVKLDVHLTVGSQTDSVTVQADASIVEAGQPAMTEVVNEKAMRDLPITSRNIYNLHTFGPGVKGIPSTGFGTTQFTFGGLNRSTWSVDGLDNTQRRTDRQIRLVINTPESVEEMQVVSNGYPAEFGRSAGGLVNVITRSGGNDWHGAILLLNRPNATSARPGLSATKPDTSWEDYAFTASGPIKRDRIFFFANYEYNPYVTPTPVAINPSAAAALGLTPNQLANAAFGETFHTPSAKVNFRINDKNNGFIRFSRFTNDQPYGSSGGLTTSDRGIFFHDRMNGGAGQLATVITPNLLNEFRFGINRRYEFREPQTPASADEYYVNITGVANFGNSPTSGSLNVETSTQFVDNLTWTKGRHTLKGGVDFQTTGFDLNSSLNRTYTFGGLSGVSPLDQYLFTVQGKINPATGRPFTYTQLSQDLGDPTLTTRFNFFNTFLQDEFRVSPKLTITAGLRYELILFPSLDSSSPYPLSRSVRNNNLNFAPRLGFSYNPFSDSKTVIRGAYGMFYDTPSLALVTNAYQINGVRLLNYTVPGTDARAPQFGQLLTEGDPAFTAPPNISPFASDFRIMVAHQGNLQIERAITNNLLVKAQYSVLLSRFGIYSRDINLPAPVSSLADGRPVYQGSLNRPDPRFRQINLLESGSNSNYNALDITVTQRFSKGLQFSGTYSWSHALSDSDQGGGALMDPSNRGRDYGNYSSDVRHSFGMHGLYAPAFTQNMKWLNGFEFSTMLWYNSGYPVNAVAGSDLNQDLTLNDRPVGIARNSFVGPGFLQIDTRLSRTFAFHERYKLQFIAEAENLTNRLNANCGISSCTGAVVNNYSARDFLRITSARTPRRLQFGFRFYF